MQVTGLKRVRANRDSAATRRALLAAGTELFAERGFKGATAELIGRRAGVNKAMINYHFGTKRRLYKAILNLTFSELIERLQALLDPARPAPELLRDFVTVFAGVARRHPSFPAMLLREVLSGGDVAREALAHIVRVFTVLREIVARGIRERSFRAVDPVLTHVGLIGSLVFFFATASFRARAIAEGRLPVQPPDPDAYVRHIQDLMTRGLAVDASGGPPSRR